MDKEYLWHIILWTSAIRVCYLVKWPFYLIPSVQSFHILHDLVLRDTWDIIKKQGISNLNCSSTHWLSQGLMNPSLCSMSRLLCDTAAEIWASPTCDKCSSTHVTKRICTLKQNMEAVCQSWDRGWLHLHDGHTFCYLAEEGWRCTSAVYLLLRPGIRLLERSDPPAIQDSSRNLQMEWKKVGISFHFLIFCQLNPTHWC